MDISVCLYYVSYPSADPPPSQITHTTPCLQLAFRPGVVDLPAGKTEAAFAAITLQETFADFEQDDLAVPDLALVPAAAIHTILYPSPCCQTQKKKHTASRS